MSVVRDERLVRPDGRIVGWSECAVADGRPVVRLPGTPGSRFNLPADLGPWLERGLRLIAIERPGFGVSTRLRGRGFAEHADDVVAVLDRLGLDRVPLFGGSGAAPHVLAVAARHPDRVSAATIVAGAAPLTDDELDAEIGFDRRADRLARERNLVGLRAMFAAARDDVLAAPVEGLRRLMDDAPAADQAVMASEEWQSAMPSGVAEALREGVDGWVDEALALHGDWADIELDRIATSLTWWHAGGDEHCPVSAARRLVARIPGARLVEWPVGGHYAGYADEGALLDELLARARRA